MMDAKLARDRADPTLLGKIEPLDLGTGLLVDRHLIPFAPGAGPDRPRGRRTARSAYSGTPRRDGRARAAGCRRRSAAAFAVAPPGTAHPPTPGPGAAALRAVNVAVVATTAKNDLAAAQGAGEQTASVPHRDNR